MATVVCFFALRMCLGERRGEEGLMREGGIGSCLKVCDYSWSFSQSEGNNGVITINWGSG